MKVSKETLDMLKENGYNSLNSYLESLSEEYGIRLYDVHMMAEVYGESELMDGLVSACADVEEMYG